MGSDHWFGLWRLGFTLRLWRPLARTVSVAVLYNSVMKTVYALGIKRVPL